MGMMMLVSAAVRGSERRGAAGAAVASHEDTQLIRQVTDVFELN